MLATNYDIEKIYVDGLAKIVKMWYTYNVENNWKNYKFIL
jgi:hypothetical protein